MTYLPGPMSEENLSDLKCLGRGESPSEYGDHSAGDLSDDDVWLQNYEMSKIRETDADN